MGRRIFFHVAAAAVTRKSPALYYMASWGQSVVAGQSPLAADTTCCLARLSCRPPRMAQVRGWWNLQNSYFECASRSYEPVRSSCSQAPAVACQRGRVEVSQYRLVVWMHPNQSGREVRHRGGACCGGADQRLPLCAVVRNEERQKERACKQ